jgi:hypothetical protein
MKRLMLSLCLLGGSTFQAAQAQDVGELILRGYVPNTTINPYAGGTIYQQNGINNPYEGFGAGVNNDFNSPGMDDASRIFDENGVYRGP